MTKYIVWGVTAVLACSQLNMEGQDWNSAGNFGLDPVNSFLGNTDGVPINFRTNNLRRMILTPTLTNQTVNGYGGLDLSGFLGIGTFNASILYGISRPYSMLHLDDNGMSWFAYRPWMRAGMMVTRGSDQCYIGLKDEGLSSTSTVVSWSDNDIGDYGPDALRFIFVGPTSQTGTASTLNGLEAARFVASATGNQCFFGLGDWNTAGLSPNQRLDLMNGRMRIRQLPNDPFDNSLYKMMVVDDFGVVRWRDAASLGACTTGWQVNSGNDPVTAYDGNPCFPQSIDRVGIGTQAPTAKLDVMLNVSNSPFDLGVKCVVSTQTQQKVAVDASTTGNGSSSWGYRAKVQGALHNTGIDIAVDNGPANGSVTGGRFVVNGGGITPADDMRAVWGTTIGGPQGSPGWAGWFDGKTFCTTGVWSASDASLKQDIEDLQGAGALLSQLSPKSYVFNSDEYGFMGLDTTLHWGLLADELELVVPHAVREVTRPTELDSSGNVVNEAVTFKALNYQELIPLLIAGHKEQEARLLDMEAQLAACCTAQDPGMAPQGAGWKATEGAGELKEQRLLVVPNPVADLTTLEYYVPQAGQVSLQVSTSDGKPLATLRQEQAEPGAYSYLWNTTKLAAGTYLCTYLLDGAVVVQRAVKVK